MISKKKGEELVKLHASRLIKKLNLQRKSITWIVTSARHHDTNKHLEDIGFPYGDYMGLTGYDTPKPKAFTIILYCDKHTTERQFISTMIHELLHVKFAKFYKYVKDKKAKQFSRQEERFVRDLEKILTIII